MIRTQLESFGFISILYALVVVLAGFNLRSASYAKYLVAYWGITTTSAWLIIFLGSLSARRDGTYVRPWRGALSLLLLTQVSASVALLPDKPRMSLYGAIYCTHVPDLSSTGSRYDDRYSPTGVHAGTHASNRLHS
jgi:hypothetical protein